tara:strand:+ start:32174 stop:33403 length:1230 start_codon:yes stop_codon:yes gene_type:complete
VCCSLFAATLSFGQGSPDYDGGYKIKFNDDGSKYFRILSWAQVQGNYTVDPGKDQNGNEISPMNIRLRRARVLMFAQITDRFMILTHFGLNSLGSSTMSPVGTGGGSQIFMHDAWAQYTIGKNHAVGAGLHYFNGISRLNNQSTLNFMTLDNNRQSWSTLGLTDQFARHVGIFGKGTFGKLQYRVAINDALTNSLDTRDPAASENVGKAVYGGKRILGSKDAGFAYAGYFEYALMDQESNFLPYKVGSYLGAKKILNIGAGFFLHPNGAAIVTDSISGNVTGENVNIMAVDVFYEAPIGAKNAAITAYGTYQTNNYGTNYLYSAYGTGSMLYGHVGFVLPGDKTKTRFQPYASFGLNSYDASSDSRNVTGLGVNAYMSGHNSKLTLEYQNTAFGSSSVNTVTLRAQIYL